MPKVSVIVPCYNVGPYVGRCLDSLINQTLHDIEIICIDDKSTDDTLKVISEYARRDKRITLIKHAKNTGVAIARNDSMARAGGEYIGFVDPDDYLPDEKVLGDLYNAAVKNKVKICGGSIVFCGMDGKDIFPGHEPQSCFDSDAIINYSQWPYDYGFTRFIYDRCWLKENNIFFPKYTRQEDPVFFTKAMSTAGRFYALKRPTYVYRINYKTVNYTNATLVDVFRGLHDCLVISREHNMWDLYLNIARHTNDFAGCVKKTDINITGPAIYRVIEMLSADIPDKFIPAQPFLRILRKYNRRAYNLYARQVIFRNRIYLFGFLPVMRVLKTRLFTDIQIFDIFTIMRVHRDARAKIYYLFKILPVLKIKN